MSSSARTIYSPGASLSSFGPSVHQPVPLVSSLTSQSHMSASLSGGFRAEFEEGAYASRGMPWWNCFDELMDFRMAEETPVMNHVTQFYAKYDTFASIFPGAHLTHMLLRTLSPHLKAAGSYFLTSLNPRASFDQLVDHLKQVQGCMQLLQEDLNANQSIGLLAPSGRRRSGPIRIEAQGPMPRNGKPYDRSPPYCTLLPLVQNGISSYYRFPLESSGNCNLIPTSSARDSPVPSAKLPSAIPASYTKPDLSSLLSAAIRDPLPGQVMDDSSDMDGSPKTDHREHTGSPPSVEIVDGHETGELEKDVAATLVWMKA